MWLETVYQYTGWQLARAGIKKPCPSPADFPNYSLSYWIDKYHFPLEEARTTQTLLDEADVVIIGSGMTGAAAAYRLSQIAPHLRVVVVEARDLCSGATGRNGGHIAKAEVFAVRIMADNFGNEDAVRMRRSVLINRDMMLEVIDKYSAAERVDLCLGGTLGLFDTEQQKDDYLQDMEFCRANGFQPECVYLSPEEVRKKMNVSAQACRFGGSFLEKSGTFYPRKFVDLLFTEAGKAMPQLNIQAYTPVIEVVHRDGKQFPYFVRTPRGDIRARTVLHATNAYARRLIPELRNDQGVFGCRSYMIAIQPDQPFKPDDDVKSGFGISDFDHWVFQRPRDPTKQDVPNVFIQGRMEGQTIEDFNDGELPANSDEILESTISDLKVTLPAYFSQETSTSDVTHQWTGIQGFTNSNASIVGQITPERPGEFLAVGFNGEGMTRCFAAATVVSDAIASHLDGKPREVPDWYPRAWLRNI